MSEPRYGFETFDCAPALRLDAHERLSRLELDGVHKRLDRIEGLIERVERRLWLTVYGVVAVVLAQAFQQLVPGAL